MSGCRRRTACTTLPLPTPEGPDSTVRRDATGRSAAMSVESFAGSGVRAAELLDQSRTLLGTKAPDAPGRADLQPLHDLGGTDLAHAGECLEDGRDLHLADDLVVVGVGQDRLEAGPGVLQTLLDLGTL